LKKLSISLTKKIPAEIHTPPTKHTFIAYSAAMWSSMIIKSLSERNFMLPLLTYTLGPELANIYKVANDGALFFQRAILKTIGTTDTSLLTHAEHESIYLSQAFQQLMSKIITICLPLLGFFVYSITYGNSILMSHPTICRLFIIITITYLIESILSPYERVLEVKSHYLKLGLAYSPYVISMIILICSPIMHYLGLVNTILWIQTVRLISSGIMVHFTRSMYGLTLPGWHTVYSQWRIQTIKRRWLTINKKIPELN
jgi:hypothetical protein